MKLHAAFGLLLAATAVLVPIIACSGGSGGVGLGGLGSSGSSGSETGGGSGPSGSSSATPNGSSSSSASPSGSSSSASPVPSGSGSSTPGGNIVCGNGSTSDFCYCNVNNTGAPPGGSCSAASVGGAGGCCASKGWPSTGSCQCTQYKCETVGSGCNCWLHSAEGQSLPSSCSPTAGQVCCVASSGLGNVCECRTGTTCAGGTQVSSCTLASTGCEANEMPVAACR